MISFIVSFLPAYNADALIGAEQWPVQERVAPGGGESGEE